MKFFINFSFLVTVIILLSGCLSPRPLFPDEYREVKIGNAIYKGFWKHKNEVWEDDRIVPNKKSTVIFSDKIFTGHVQNDFNKGFKSLYGQKAKIEFIKDTTLLINGTNMKIEKGSIYQGETNSHYSPSGEGKLITSKYILIGSFPNSIKIKKK